MKHSVLHCFFH